MTAAATTSLADPTPCAAQDPAAPASPPPASPPAQDPAAPAEPAPAEPPPSFVSHFELRNSNTLEVRYDRIETPILGADPKQNIASGWLFSNESLLCNFEACNGSSLVIRPRLTWQLQPETDPDFYFHELYLSMSAIPRVVLTVGSQVQGWGPGIFYSPTNRMFPETLFTTAVREPIRRRLVAINVEVLSKLTLFLTAARADDSDWGADDALRSYFGSSRIEYQAEGEHPYTLGVVGGGGNRFQPYGGMYLELTLSDAWTGGAEFSASKGYSRDRDPSFGPPGSFMDEDAWGADGLVNLRYGLKSGGELGIEASVNQFALRDSAQQQLATLYPALLAGTDAGAGIHPVLDRRYVMVHARIPELPPAKHVTFSTSLMYTNPSDSLVASGELAVNYDSFKGYVSFDLNFGPDASVQRFPYERFVRAGVSFTH
jgi:hypothetical protein